MTGFNLPPGCSVSDIPGNRPEDMEWEAIYEAFFDKKRIAERNSGIQITPENDKQIANVYEGKNAKLVEAVDNYIIMAIEYGRELGNKEGYETAQENAMYDRMAHFEYRIPYLRQYFKALRQRASEVWLYNNFEALASVKRGLDDAKAGRISESEEDIQEMHARHKAEIKELQARCSHHLTAITTAFEERTFCNKCGKILKRRR